MLNNTFLLTALSLFAFAANSVFSRLALAEGQIDAGSFTVIRLLSGSLFLIIFLAVKSFFFNSSRSSNQPVSRGSWSSALWLFIYAVAFSYAYIQLDTATGALVLFAVVQVTMLMIGLFKGRRLSKVEWLGLMVAVAGFVYLLAPQFQSPSLNAFLLMTIAGISWALYTLAGKKSVNPSSDTIFNFLRTIPFVCALIFINMDSTHLSVNGVMNAVFSGVFASALGYLLWYQALKGLDHNVAAVVQLLVPVLAAIAGFILLNEMISLSFLISSLMILGGILLVIKKPNLKFLNYSK